jgi:hypothetical protein
MRTMWKVVGALALIVLVAWIFTVGFGHGSGGSPGTTTIRLHTTP